MTGVIARKVLYLAQTEKLKASDPVIHKEFLAGNFCVYKSNALFCAVDPDHTLEQVSKLMEIYGGLKGLTWSPSAMALHMS